MQKKIQNTLGKKANITLYFVFLIVAIIVILITAVFAPMGVLFTQEMLTAGESIMLEANSSISQIQNDTIKNSVTATMGRGLTAADTNIEVNSILFQYGWIFVLICSALVLFLFTRSLIEYGRGGGLI